MLRPHLLGCALLLALSGPALAHKSSCDVDSNYDVKIRPQALELKSEDNADRVLKISDGRLWVNGEELAVNRADQQRLRDIERHARVVADKAKDIALDAVALAGEAVARVGAALGGKDGDALAKRIDTMRAEISARIENRFEAGDFDDEALEREVESMVKEFVPAIAGEVASLAITAALSGDEAAAERFEQRMKNFEQDIEREMKARGKALEQKAESLCPDLRKIDELDEALEVRLADGSPLNLVTVER